MPERPSLLLAETLDASRRDLVDGRGSLAAGTALFDALVCMAAGAGGLPDAVHDAERGPSSIVGTHRSTGALSAAVRNALAAHLLDLDDLHWPSVTHPGSIIWPALLAVGQARSVPLETLRDAAVLGYQVVARLSDILGSRHRGAFHATATCGAVGAAAATASAVGADDDGIVAAMAHAASGMGGTGQAMRERSRTSVHHRGFAVSNALIAGLHRDLRPEVSAPLLGDAGFLTATGVAPKREALRSTVPPAISEITVRRHPVTGFAHTLVDAVLDIAPEDPDDVTALEAEVPSFVLALTEQDLPTTAHEASWHLGHAVASALNGDLSRARLPWPPPPATLALRRRIRFSPRSASPPDIAVRGQLHLRDGAVVEFDRAVPRGHPDDPMIDDELLAKAQRLGVARRPEAEDLLAWSRASTGPIAADVLDGFTGIGS